MNYLYLLQTNKSFSYGTSILRDPYYWLQLVVDIGIESQSPHITRERHKRVKMFTC